MSIFSSIRRSRQEAKDHSAQLAEQKQKETDKAPYKHVPTHAATDAYASAPPSWREADRPRIAEQNRRRSAMAASGHHMNMVGVPRVGSSLSHVSFPAEDSSPMVRLRMPRAYSYNGVSPYAPYGDPNRDVLYSVPDLVYAHQPASLKGKVVVGAPGSEMRGVDPNSSNGEHSPDGSSSGSASSQDNLEMMAANRAARSRVTSDKAHRLHPAHSRRTSDGSFKSSVPAGVQLQSSGEFRPPLSMKGFTSISALAVPGVSPDASSGGSSSGPVPASTSASRQSSTASLLGLTPSSSRLPLSNPTTPGPFPVTPEEFPLNGTVVQLPVTDVEVSSSFNEATSAPGGRFNDRRVSKTTRFTGLERIDSIVEPPYVDYPQNELSPQPQFINAFPEPAAEVAAPPTKSKGKSKTLTKGGGKLVKRSRTPAAMAV